MTDELVITLLVSSFAACCILHTIVVVGLLRDDLREGLLALLLPPLAPVLAWRRRRTWRALGWGALVVFYIVLRVAL